MKDVFPPSFTDLNTLFNQAPVAMAYLKGLELVVEAANFSMLELWGKNAEIIGKPILDALPEIIDQPFPLLLKTVYSSGEEHYGNETKALLVRNGVPETCYFNFVYSPIKDFQGTITGVSVIASEVTAYNMNMAKNSTTRDLASCRGGPSKKYTATLTVTKIKLQARQ